VWETADLSTALPGRDDNCFFRCSSRPGSSQEHLPTSIAGVLRLRALKPSVSDRFAKRFAQDDVLGGCLKKNILIELALMELCLGLSSARPVQISFARCLGSATALSLQRPSPFCHPERSERICGAPFVCPAPAGSKLHRLRFPLEVLTHPLKAGFCPTRAMSPREPACPSRSPMALPTLLEYGFDRLCRGQRSSP
jgi:hypothetical protein